MMRFSENAWGMLKMCADLTELDKEGMLLCIRDGNIDERIEALLNALGD